MVLLVACCAVALGIGGVGGFGLARRTGRAPIAGSPRTPDRARIERWLAAPASVPWDDSPYALVAAYESAVVRHSQYKARVAFGTDDEHSSFAVAHALAAQVDRWRTEVLTAIDEDAAPKDAQADDRSWPTRPTGSA